MKPPKHIYPLQKNDISKRGDYIRISSNNYEYLRKNFGEVFIKGVIYRRKDLLGRIISYINSLFSNDIVSISKFDKYIRK